ncbi:MAG: cytochrome c peroxidase [Paracoccaceae bacterium]
MPKPPIHALVATILCCTPLTAAAQVPSWPEPVYRQASETEVTLGQRLFYDPILSGNRNISCATCHHPRFATSDGLSLGMGEGGIGLGPERHPDPADLPEQRIPRNAPALFNLGAEEFTVLFHDGRIEVDPARPGGLRTPLDDEMVQGFANILSAQTMFPVLSADEMAGHYEENDVSRAVRMGRITGDGGAWDVIAKRIEALPEYRTMFASAYPDIAEGRPIAFTDISNAIAAFVGFEWRSDNSAFDRALRGEAPLTAEAEAGQALFYGKAGCGTCHSGRFQTDHGFHAMAAPQIGPGKAERFERHQRDIGRMRVTGRDADAYAFRTPSLRNVAATGPWGHAGAHSDLRAFVVDHLNPTAALSAYQPQATLPDMAVTKDDFAPLADHDEQALIARAVTAPPVSLSEDEIDQIIAFLGALTDQGAIDGRLGVPETVPSGLPVDR